MPNLFTQVWIIESWPKMMMRRLDRKRKRPKYSQTASRVTSSLRNLFKISRLIEMSTVWEAIVSMKSQRGIKRIQVTLNRLRRRKRVCQCSCGMMMRCMYQSRM